MRILRFLWKWWREIWQPKGTMHNGIDSHKWETKIEIFRRLSSKRH